MNGGDRQRREGRGLWWAWTLLLVAVVAAGGFVATRTGLLDVDRVEVVGSAGRLSAEQLRAAAEVRVGVPMVEVDLGAIDRRVTALPWVAEVGVEREWPGTIRVSVSQRVPVVNGVDPVGGLALLDRTGIVLEWSATADTGLATIRVDALGPPGSRIPGIEPLLRAAEAVTPDLGRWIVALAPTGDGVRAELVGGVDAELGFGEDYRDEMRSLATVLTRVVLACLVTIDVSIHESPVLLRDESRC